MVLSSTQSGPGPADPLWVSDGARPKMTGLVKVSWVLYNTVTMASFAITIGYWSAIYSPGIGSSLTHLFLV